MRKSMLSVVLVSIICVFALSACAPVDWFFGLFGYQKPVSNENLVVSIDGHGSSNSYGDPFVGRKIIVRDDLKPDENGWYTREIYKVESLQELDIAKTFEASFPIEYERDFSQAKGAFVGYMSMNVSKQVDASLINEFLGTYQDVVGTTVVNRQVSKNNIQECSLKGILPEEAMTRYVLYYGEGISFQTCDPSWSIPQ